MRNQTVRRVTRYLSPEILALAVAVFWAVGPATAAEAQMTRASKTEVDIFGGNGKETWRLRYGVGMQSELTGHFVVGEGHRAWYSRGGWLRLIDTQKGVVLGRWHYPGEIVNLTPEGQKVLVEIEDERDSEQRFRRKYQLDPSDPHVPFWPTNFLLLFRIPLNEGEMLWGAAINNGSPEKIPAEEAKKMLPELEEAVRRDPFTPWFRVGLGRVLRDLGDPRAAQEFQAAINSPGTDFTELLRISTYFDGIGDNEMSRAAFDRGYQDFWQRGNDPRVFAVLIYKLMIYFPKGGDWGNPSTPLGRELIERTYKMMPYGEGTEVAWRVYADYLSVHGRPDDAKLWRTRAEESSHNFTPFGIFAEYGDRWLLLTLGSACALIIYSIVLFFRYRPQRRLDMAARERAGTKTRTFAFLNTEYWSRAQRVAFFIIVLVGWFGIGIMGQYVTAILRGASSPIGSFAGNFGGPVTIASFQHDLPATAERDMLLAIAYQQDGQLDKAEALYRKLPQFAESWNNLGVILKAQGKSDEAKAAFEKALALDPRLAEASLNLGNPPSDFWTQQHQKYLPGQPMLAPPSQACKNGAYRGGSETMVMLRALAGPFSTSSVFGLFELLGKLIG